MSSLILSHHNHADLLEALSGDVWIVACLCAAWCDVCRQYRPDFDALAERHPDKRFIWVDVEDEADIVGEFDVENFPTLLIQRADTVAFYGTVMPDAAQAHRLLQAQVETTPTDLLALAQSSAQRREWQTAYNLRARLVNAINE